MPNRRGNVPRPLFGTTDHDRHVQDIISDTIQFQSKAGSRPGWTNRVYVDCILIVKIILDADGINIGRRNLLDTQTMFLH